MGLTTTTRSGRDLLGLQLRINFTIKINLNQDVE